MEWRSVPGWPMYEASSAGTIRNVRTGRIMAGSISKKTGYRTVVLCSGSRWGFADTHKMQPMNLHRAVCMAFKGPPPFDGACAAHLDGNRQNNLPSNLDWKTYAGNDDDKRLHGTHGDGIDNHAAVLTENQVRSIRSDTRLQRQIAADYGISQSMVSRIKRRASWRTLGEQDHVDHDE